MRRILFFLMIFSSFLIRAQNLELIYDEEFDNNDKDWVEGDNEDRKAEIANGYYFMYNKNDDNIYRFWNEFSVDADKNDFLVEAKIRQIYGQDDVGYGIFIAGSGINNNYGLEIRSDGQYRTYERNDGDYDNRDWHKTDFIKEKGQFNILKIRKKSKYLYFYVNGQLLNVKKYNGSYGTDYGFVLTGKIKIQVDYFKIYSVKPKINLVDNPINNPKENLGTAINTYATEIIPVISADGKILYFCRDNYKGNVGKNKDHNDIWYSKFENGHWTQAKNIGRPLNNEGHNFVIFASPDNNTLILNGTYTTFGESGSNGISITHKNRDGTWQIPKKIEIDNFYNDDKYQNFTFTPDLSVLVMALERSDDTYGKSDLYVSFRKPDGSYTEPQNMGPDINTSGEEGTPTIAPDGKTLYFYSDGLPGYGSADIFVSKRLDNTWKHWSTPQNMGPSINSSDWDAYFTVDAKGEYAYLVSSANSIGEEDIFRIKLTEEQKPNPVVLIYGTVYDKKTHKPISASILYNDLSENKDVDATVSDPQTGEYKIVLPYGKNYGFFAKRSGYVPLSDNIDLTQISDYKEIRRDLYLVPIKKDESVVLNNIFFKAGKSILLPSSFPELDRLVKTLKKNPKMKIEIQGHTNNIGKHDELVKLSEERAKAVKEYLVGKGIDASRISTVGYGPDKPRYDNSTPSGRVKNQRVEFKIINK